MVLLTAPLGLIGVTAGFLRDRDVPFGFVAHAGDDRALRHDHAQLDHPGRPDRAGRHRRPPPWDAIVDATVRRFRPIVLTAAAAVLAMIPLVAQQFLGPMAVAMMGGILVATVLTLVFLPALYAAWFRVRRPAE